MREAPQRRWRSGVLAVLAVLTATIGCSSSTSDDSSPDTTIEDNEEAGQPVDFEALDIDVDEVVTVRPGGSARPDQGLIGDGEIIFSDHVLRVQGPDGPIDLFDLVIRMDEPGPGGDEPQRCSATIAMNSSSMSCGPVDEADRGAGPLLQGSTSSDGLLLLELVGPAEATHFIVVHDEVRIGVNSIEGRSVLPISTPEGPCPEVPLLVEAWADDELLRSEQPIDHC